MVSASQLTDEQIKTELNTLGKKWDAFREAIDEEGGHGGSPGEWMIERMDELETEQRKRLPTPPSTKKKRPRKS